MAAASSYASFELALLLQNYDNPNGFLETSITRWDPMTRVYLGRFAVPVSSSYKLALPSDAPGTVDLMGRLNSSVFEIRRYDYSTGMLVNVTSLSISTNSISEARFASSGNLLLSGNFSGTIAARLYSTSGALIRSYSNPSGTLEVLDAVQDGSGVTYVLTRQAGTTSNFKYTVSSYAQASSTLVNSTVVLDNSAERFHSLNLWNGILSVGKDVLSDRRFASVSGTTLGSFSPTGGWLVATDSMAPGHFDTLHGFGYDATNTRMVFSTARINTATGNTFEYRNGSTFQGISDSVIVLAPEPGTFVAVGLGLAALLKRRRRR